MVVGTRYAKSLLNLAIEHGQLEPVYKDMLMIRSVSKSNPDFVNMLESPLIKTDKKQSILKLLFEGKVNELTMKFMMLMAEKKREGYLDDISFSFVDQYKQHKNIVTAVLTSAVPMDSETKFKILSMVQQSVNGTVEIEEKIDANLIGGFKIKVGDRQVDASVQRKLNDLKKSFSHNPFVKDF
jgi:F-type H+-transporting ATPase subunit delta